MLGYAHADRPPVYAVTEFLPLKSRPTDIPRYPSSNPVYPVQIERSAASGKRERRVAQLHENYTEGRQPFARRDDNCLIRLVAKGGIEPPTQGFSVLCSTN